MSFVSRRVFRRSVETSAEAFERMFRVNQLGVLLGMKSVAPLMKADDKGIRVNSVHPGPIPTGINEDFLKERLEFLLSRIPLRRLGEPKDVAEAVAYFASEGAKYVTGAEISVDGGFAA
jgi:NAD(P)-dependent dehydrogenase (short-subunit alcohol dehydrogenase family)